MNKSEESDLSASQGIFDLLNGLENKDTVLWGDGNTGSFAIETVDGSCTRKLTDTGMKLEQMGVTILLKPVEI